MKLYIAGPISGLPDDNRAAFKQAYDLLTKLGHHAVNPFDLDQRWPCTTWEEYMRRDTSYLMTCEGAVFLDGWRYSKGAKKEHQLCLDYGLHCYQLDWGKQELVGLKESVLLDAEALINGDRQQSYGHPADDFARQGKMWAVVLGTEPIPPEKVAMCMVCTKVCRELNSHSPDNPVDMAGYAGTIELIRRRQIDG